MAGRDVSLHPPVLEFVRVNRPASDILSVAPSPPWVPPLGFVRPVPPARQFHPRGFSPPRRLWHTERSGFVAPQYRTGFAEFPTPWNPHPKMLAVTCLPNQRVHTLRRFPLAGSRTASLQPLPPRRSPNECTSRWPHDLRGSHSLWLDLRIGSEDPPASRVHASTSIAGDRPSTDRRPSGQRTVAGTHLPDRTVLTFRFDPSARFFAGESGAPIVITQQVA